MRAHIIKNATAWWGFYHTLPVFEICPKYYIDIGKVELPEYILSLEIKSSYNDLKLTEFQIKQINELYFQMLDNPELTDGWVWLQ